MSGAADANATPALSPTALALADAARVMSAAASTKIDVAMLEADVAAGAHLVAVGACRPDQREMPTMVVARARVFVDSREAAKQEAGDLLIPVSEGAITLDHVAGELGEVIGRRIPGRIDDRQVTVFKSLGLAVEDMVAAHLALTRAHAAGLGQPFSW